MQVSFPCNIDTTGYSSFFFFFLVYIFLCALIFDYLIFRRSLVILDICSARNELSYVSWFLGLLELASLMSVSCPCKCLFHATQTQQVTLFLFFLLCIFLCVLLTFDYFISRRSLVILDICSFRQAYLVIRIHCLIFIVMS